MLALLLDLEAYLDFHFMVNKAAHKVYFVEVFKVNADEVVEMAKVHSWL